MLCARVAAGEPQRFDIPPQEAPAALRQFAIQANASVLFPFDALEGVRTNGVSGTYEAADALAILIDGTGLGATLTPNGQLIVHVPLRDTPPEPEPARAERPRPAAPAPPPSRSESLPAPLPEIVVTARRREESLQDVPVSMLGLSAEELELKSMQRLENLSAAVPNVSLLGGPFGVNQSSFTMRGIPRVSTFVDGIWQANGAGLLLRSIVDVDRVEVLRGPQGTLFGRDSTGGAIRIVTRRPAEDFATTLSLAVGSHERSDVQISADLPFAETLRTKWTFADLYRDGYVESVTVDRRYGSIDNEIVRGDVLWSPSDRFDLRVIYERNEFVSNGQPRLIEEILPADAAAEMRLNVAEQLRAAGYVLTPESHVSGHPGGALGAWQTRMDSVLDSTDIDYTQLTVDTTWLVTDAIELKSLTGLRRQYTKDFTDWDAAEIDMIEDDRRFLDRDWSEELQLSGGRGRVRWVTGLYAWENKALNRFFRFAYTDFKRGVLDFDAVLAACAPPPGGDGRVGCSMLPDQDFGGVAVNRGWAAFGETVVELTERWSLTVGGRYHDERQRSATRTFLAPGPSGPDVDPPGDLFAGADSEGSRARFDHFTKRVALGYRIGADKTAYASYAEGFNSGGVARLTEPNPETGVNETFLYPFDPETIRNYEVGLRSYWLDRRLRLNATAFLTEWRNIQLAGHAPDPFNPGRYLNRTLTSNVAAAEAKGVEVEIRLAARGGWDLDLNAGFLDTRYTEVSPRTTDVALGDVFGQAPELTASVGVQKRWRLPSAADVKLRLDYVYTDEFTRSRVPAFQRGTVTGTDELEAGGFGLGNVRLSYAPASDRWEAALVGTNLTNERYLNSGHTIPAWGWDMGTVGRPREVAATLRVRMR